MFKKCSFISQISYNLIQNLYGGQGPQVIDLKFFILLATADLNQTDPTIVAEDLWSFIQVTFSIYRIGF